MGKNIIKILMLLAVMVFLPTITFAKNGQEYDAYKEDIGYRQSLTVSYISFGGTIIEVNNYDGVTYITVESNETSKIFKINEETIVLNNENGEKLKPEKLYKGQNVNIFFSGNTPASLSYPPQILAETVIVKNDKHISVKQDIFNENFLSSDGNLELNVSNETKIVNLQGDTVSKEDAKNETLIVFYSATTRSIPPQTSPSKIIVLNKNMQNKYPYNTNVGIYNENNTNGTVNETLNGKEKDLLSKMEKEHVHKKENVIYVALYAVAKEIGYEISWEEKTREVILRNEDNIFKFKVGKRPYVYNGEEYILAKPPILINNRVFVEISFLDKLIGY